MAVSHVLDARRVITGAGAIGALPGELAACGVHRALVISGPRVAAGPVLADVLGHAGDVVVGTFPHCSANAPLETVALVADAARRLAVDGLVSVGGGSAHDAAKGTAVLLGEGGRLADHATSFIPPDQLLVPPLRGRRVPIVTVGTTFSAAEATRSAGFADEAARTKVVVVDAAAPVRSVIIDPQLAATTPADVLAASAGNALNHCVEAIYSRGHGPLTDAFATSALRLLVDSVADAVKGDLAALEASQVGAYLSGLAMPGTGLGINHAVCHILGVYGASHGAANSAMLAHGMRFNARHAADRMAIIGAALGLTDAVAGVESLLDSIGAPTRLRDTGVNQSDLVDIAARAVRDRHMYANPRPVHDPADLLRLLEAAW